MIGKHCTVDWEAYGSCLGMHHVDDDVIPTNGACPTLCNKSPFRLHSRGCIGTSGKSRLVG